MKVISLYFILISFISAFSLNQWLPVPMIISFLLLVGLVLTFLKNQKIILLKPYVLISLFGFFIMIMISFLKQTYFMGFQLKGLTHTISYFVIILMYYSVVELSLRSTKMPIDKVFKSISIGVVFASVFTIVEFISKNFLGINFDSFIPRSQVQEFSALYSGRFIRARGTAEESGPMAMYLLMFLPFVFYYYKVLNPKKIKLLFSTIIILSAITTTFSATGFFELLTALIFISCYYLAKKIKKGFTKKEYLFMYLLSFMGVIFGIYALYSGLNFTYFSGIMDKLTFSNNSVSAGSRLDRWSDALDLIKDSPFLGSGAGIAAILNGTGSTSMYLEVLSESGILGFAFLIIVFFISFISIFKIKSNVKYVYLFSYTVMVIHLFVISQYWNPWIWALISVINYHSSLMEKEHISKEEKELLSKLKTRSI